MSSNFRHHLLSLSLLVGIAAPWAAFAQAPISSVGSGSVEDRVTQLERISNAHSQLLTQLQQQLSDNQSDIDSLRGQIQENQYQLNQVVERQKQILLQMNNLGSGSAPAAQSAAGDQSGAATPAPDAGAAASSGTPAQTGDANTDYNAAIALVVDVIAMAILLFATDLGVYAIVVAMIIYAVVMCLLNERAMKQYMQYKNPWRSAYLNPLLASVPMAVVAGFSYYGIYKLIHSNFISLGIAVVLGMVAYFIVYLAVSKPSDEQFAMMPGGAYLKKIAGKLPF